MIRDAASLANQARRHGIDLFARDRRFDRHPTDLPAGLHLLTGSSASRPGELVVVTGSRPQSGARGDEWRVRVRYPERPGDHSYETPAENLLARADADGGWFEVPPAAITGKVNCPSCGSFMRTEGGRTGFGGEDPLPKAYCTKCDVALHFDELERDGLAVRLL